MITVFTLETLLEEAERCKNIMKNVQLDFTQNQGVNNVVDVIKRGGMSLGIGPPGTGKTIVFNYVHDKIFDELDKDEVVLYIAPTNRLVAECAIRTLALLLNRGIDERDIRHIIRIYGSKFKALPLTEDVKYIFTTPYQPGALMHLLKMGKRVHIMVDEASTTPLHQPFISIAMTMSNAIKEGVIEWFNSFSVIGDPMQAIVQEYTGREKFELLIVGRVLLQSIPEDERAIVKNDPAKIFELANKYAPSIGMKYFFLDSTYRIPNPTELLVSIPFYNGMLKGVEDYKKRLKGIKREEPSLKSKILEHSEILKKMRIAEALDHAFDSQIPIVYLRDKGYAYNPTGGRRPPELEELDVLRAKLACEVAMYLTVGTLSWIDMEVLTPYLEMKTQIKMSLRRFAERIPDKEHRRLRVSTIHSALGSEADIVIVAMGKEYVGEKEETIYFQTPELLNIQYSRHKRMLIIIGNIEKMVKEFEKNNELKYIIRLQDAISELKQRELIKIINIG